MTSARTYRCERCCRNSSRRSSGQQAKIKGDRSGELNRLPEGERSGLARDPVQSLSQSYLQREEVVAVRPPCAPKGARSERGGAQHDARGCVCAARHLFVTRRCRARPTASGLNPTLGGPVVARGNPRPAPCAARRPARGLAIARILRRAIGRCRRRDGSMAAGLCMLGVGSIAQQVVLPLAARSSLAAAVKYDAQDQIRTNTRPSARGRREAGGAGGRRGGCARRPELPARTTTRSVVRKKGTMQK